MTSLFDRASLTNDLSHLIANKKTIPSNKLNVFVQRKSFQILKILFEKINLQINTLSFEYNSSNLSRDSISFTFKMYFSEMTLIVDRRGYYELRFFKTVGNVYHVYQFFEGEEDKLLSVLQKYYEENPIKVDHYLKKISGYVMFTSNAMLRDNFQQLSEELSQCATVVGFKDRRFSIIKYVDIKYRPLFNSMKYAIAFKKGDNMVALIVDPGVKKNDNVSIGSLQFKLYDRTVMVQSHSKNISYKNLPDVLNFLNS